jgi:hypothetical protein
MTTIADRTWTRRKRGGLWLPAGALVESFPYTMATSAALPIGASGVLRLWALLETLEAGQAYSSITFIAGSTGAGTPLNQWACLCDQSRNVLVKSADTTNAWAANAPKTFTFSAPYTPAVDTAVYYGLMVRATTQPTVCAINGNVSGASRSPVLVGDSTTGLTNPASLGATAAALTATTGVQWAYLS